MPGATKGMPFQFTTRWTDVVPLIQEAIKDPSRWERVTVLLEERDRALENYLSQQPIIFDHDADVTFARSKPWTAKTFNRVREWSVELGIDDDGTYQTAASDLVFQLWINDEMKLEMTLPTGEHFITCDDGRMPDIPAGGRLTIVDEIPGVDYVSTVWL